MTESRRKRKATAKSPTSVKTPYDRAKGKEYNSSPRIGLLLGNDVSALEVANITVKNLVRAGYTPVLFMAAHKPSTKPAAHQEELQNLGFYERYLTNNTIYPIVESMPPLLGADGQPRDDTLYTPQQLADLYGLEMETVSNINSPEFIERIREDKKMPLVVSCRCYQIAHDELITAQTEKDAEFRRGETRKGGIWNLHPGKLPEYRGIFGPIYAMNNQQRTYRWTLHGMIYDAKATRKGIDAGPIMTSTSRAIDYSRPAVELYTHMARDAGKMLYDRIEDFFGGTVPLTATPQAKLAETEGRKGQYYSHPDPQFFENQWSNALERLVNRADSEGFHVNDDIRERVAAGDSEPEVVNPDLMLDHLMKSFRPEGADERKRLRGVLQNAIIHWENAKDVLLGHHEPNANENHGFVDSALKTGRIIHRDSNGNGHNAEIDPALTNTDI